MGLFDMFFKKKEKPASTPQLTQKESTISQGEKKYYQPDSYYTDVVAKGTVFEHKVISFEERKKTAIPSSRGLYPAEILF